MSQNLGTHTYEDLELARWGLGKVKWLARLSDDQIAAKFKGYRQNMPLWIREKINRVKARTSRNAVANRLVKAGKTAVKNVRLTMRYTITVYRGGQIERKIREASDDYQKVKFKSVNEYEEKLNAIKLEMYNRINQQVGSGEEITEYAFVVEDSLSYKQLRQNARNPANIPVYKADKVPIDYQFLPADLNTDDEGYGMPMTRSCVDVWILKTYKKHLPTLNQKELDDVMGKVSNKFSLDDVDDNAPKGVPHRTCTAIQEWCAHRKVAHYALTADKCLFFKNTNGSKFNYPPLIYFIADAHLYPVTDVATRRHIINSNADKSTDNIDIGLKNAQTDKKKIQIRDDKQNMFSKRLSAVDVPVSVLKDMPSNVNYFYHKLNLHDVMRELYQTHGTVGQMYHVGDKLVRIHLKKWGIDLYSNRNHSIGLDWTDSIQACKDLGLTFTNQGMPEIANEHFSLLFHVDGERMWDRTNISKTVKDMVRARQEGLCATCGIECVTYEIDHIQSLAMGGHPLGAVNAKGVQTYSNLQCLCKACHNIKTRKENASRLFKTDNTKSAYNMELLSIFSQAKNAFVHSYDPYAYWRKRVFKGQSFLAGFDINKCRTEILYRNEYDFCVFSVLDNIIEFNKDDDKHKSIPCGHYRVVPSNSCKLLPFKGTGFYSWPLVKFALKEKLIQLTDITHCVFPSLTVKHDYYKSFIESVRSKMTNPKHAKILINSFIGSFGHKVSKSRDVHLTTSLNEASWYKFTKETSDTTVHCHKMPNSDMIEVVSHSQKYLEETRVPIFNQILDMEAIELYKLHKMLVDAGGKPICLNTDNVVAEFTFQEQVDAVTKTVMAVHWDDKKEFPKFKPETKVLHGDRQEVIKEDYFFLNKVEYDIVKDDKDDDFKKLVKKMLDRNCSFQIDGRAGCGKTTLLQMLIEELSTRCDPKKILCMAPTNKACRVLGHDAQTLHSKWATMKGNSFNAWKYYDWVIIDEKSMVMEHFWKSLVAVKHANANCKFIISGDWMQLLPVMDRIANFDYANSKALHEICDGVMLRLDKCRRANDVLFNMCKDPSKVNPMSFPKKECARSLCYNNSFRRKINAARMEEFRKKTMYLPLPKHPENKEGQDMSVYEGLPLIACETTSKNRDEDTNEKSKIANSDEYEVVSFDTKNETIKLRLVLSDGERGGNINLPYLEVSRLFHPAYCISVHRSQGLTFSNPYTIYQWSKMQSMGDEGNRLVYVALSRAASEKLINIVM